MVRRKQPATSVAGIILDLDRQSTDPVTKTDERAALAWKTAAFGEAFEGPKVTCPTPEEQLKLTTALAVRFNIDQPTAAKYRLAWATLVNARSDPTASLEDRRHYEVAHRDAR